MSSCFKERKKNQGNEIKVVKILLILCHVHFTNRSSLSDPLRTSKISITGTGTVLVLPDVVYLLQLEKIKKS